MLNNHEYLCKNIVFVLKEDIFANKYQQDTRVVCGKKRYTPFVIFICRRVVQK
jgi:hypothetical protein